MKRILVVFAVLGLMALTLNGCGYPVTVPPAHVGKLSTSSGLQEGIIPPSKLRLTSWCITCDDLILAEASDFPIEETMEVFMPEDQLNLKVDVRGTVSIASNQETVDNIFARITADQTQDERVQLIPFQKVYRAYGEPIVREVVRSIVTKYKIEEVMDNRDRISQELTETMRDRLKTTPITVLQFGLADLQPPAVIVAAQEARKEREVAIQKAEAQKQVSLKEAEAALEVAIKQQEVDLKEAETQVLVDETLAKGVSPAFVAQRMIKVLDTLARSDNKVFFLPTEAMSNPAVMLGSLGSAFQLTGSPHTPNRKDPVTTTAVTSAEQQPTGAQ